MQAKTIEVEFTDKQLSLIKQLIELSKACYWKTIIADEVFFDLTNEDYYRTRVAISAGELEKAFEFVEEDTLWDGVTHFGWNSFSGVRWHTDQVGRYIDKDLELHWEVRIDKGRVVLLTCKRPCIKAEDITDYIYGLT